LREEHRQQLSSTDTLDYSPQSSQPIIIPSPFSFTALAFFFFGVVLLLLLIVGIIKNWSLLTASTSVLIQVVIILCVIGLPATLIGVGIQKGYLSWVSMRQAKLDVQAKELALERVSEEIENIRQQRIRDNEAHQMQLYLAESRLPADERGNRPAIYKRNTDEVILLPSGNFAQPVPAHYAPRFEYKDTSTRVSEEQQQHLLTQSINLPTFGKLLAQGMIYPGMQDMLLCFEMMVDEETGAIIGTQPYRDILENNSTMFLAGASKSGKTTLLSHIAGQEALINAAFYVIDPHLIHPEKSIARRLAPLSHAFILPPAMTDTEIFTVLEHAKAEADARLNGRETVLSGRPIVFIADEILAVISRAQRTDNKEIHALYRDLCLFMRDLGTQYAKFLMAGIFASQYATKDAFKLPGMSIDFRDGCHNQTILRMPPNQAQAMRLLQREELREVRSLPPGQGYMGLYTGEIMRMGIGDVEVSALQEAGRMLSAISTAKTFPKQQGTSFTSHIDTGFNYLEDGEQDTLDTPLTEQCGNHSYKTTTNSVLKQTQPSVETVPGASQTIKTFTQEEELQFIRLYREQPNIKECLKKMGKGTGYYSAAVALVERFNLRKRGQQVDAS
jgi:hypothetical protein